MYDLITNIFINCAVGFIAGSELENYVDTPYMMSKSKKSIEEFKIVREDFTNSLIDVILKNIVNTDNISNVFTNDSVRKEFNSIADRLLNGYLFREKNKIKDISAFRDIYFYSTDVIKSLTEQNIEKLLNYPDTQNQALDVFSKKQISYMSEKLYNNLVLILEKTNLFPSFINEVMDDIKDEKITDIIPGEIIDTIYKNIKNQDKNIIGYIKENELNYFDSFFDDLLKTIKVDKVIGEAKKDILNKPIKQFLTIKESDIRKYISYSINDFFDTKDAYIFCEDLYFSIISFLEKKSINLRLNIPNDYKEIFTEYFEKYSNNIAYSCTAWLHNNIEKINTYINDAVDNNVKNTELRKKFKNTFISNMGKMQFGDSSISEIFVELAENKKSSLNDISKYLLGECEQYIDSISVNNIIKLLEEDNVIGVNRMLEYLKTSFNDSTFISSISNYLINLPMSTIYNSDIENLTSKTFKYLYIDYFEKNIFLNNKFTENILSIISKDIKSLKTKTFEQTILYKNSIDVINNTKNICVNYVKNNSSSIINIIKTYITDFLKGKSIQDVLCCFNGINKAIDSNIAEGINEKSKRHNVDNIDNLGNISFTTLSQNIRSMPGIIDNTSIAIKSLTEEIIAIMLNDYLSASIRNHYRDISDSEFVRFVESTNPYSTVVKKSFGILTGGIVGLGATMLLNNNTAYSSAIAYVASWQGVLTCGLSGTLANVTSQLLASRLNIKNSYLSKIPVLKNATEEFVKVSKNNLAKYIHDLTDQSLYDSDKIRLSIKKESNQLKNHIYEILVSNDYEIIKEFYSKYIDYIGNSICSYTNEKFSQDKSFFIKNISNALLNAPVKYAFDRSFIDQISVKATESATIKDNVISLTDKYLKSNRSVIEAVLDKAVNGSKYLMMDYIKGSYKNIFSFVNNTGTFGTVMKAYNSQYTKNIENRLSDILNNEYIESVRTDIYNNAYKQYTLKGRFNNDIKSICEKINNRIFTDYSLSDILSKKSKLIASGMLHKYFSDIIHDFEIIAANNSYEQLENQLYNSLQVSLTAKEKKEYTEINGDYILKNILSDLININLHSFIDDNIEQFYVISKNLLNQAYNIKLSDLNIRLDSQLFTESLLNSFKTDNQNLLRNKFYYLCDNITEKLDNIKASDLLSLINMNNTASIINGYENEISKVNRNIYNSIIENYNDVIQSFEKITAKYSDIVLSRMINSVLFSNISRENINTTKNNYEKLIKDKDWIYYGVNSLLNQAYDYLDVRDCFYNFLNKDDLQKYIEILYNRTITDNQFKQYVNEVVEYILKNELFNEIKECFPGSILDKLLYYIADSINIDIHDSLPSLFSSVSLEKIINDGINNISTDEYKSIYKCFNTVRKSSLIKSGLYGAASGINKYVGMFLSFVNLCRY